MQKWLYAALLLPVALIYLLFSSSSPEKPLLYVETSTEYLTGSPGLGLVTVKTTNLGESPAESVTVRVQGKSISPENGLYSLDALKPGETHYSYFIVESPVNGKATAKGLNTTLATSDSIDVPISWFTMLFTVGGLVFITYRKCSN
jgi:hypothetical protein